MWDVMAGTKWRDAEGGWVVQLYYCGSTWMVFLAVCGGSDPTPAMEKTHFPDERDARNCYRGMVESFSDQTVTEVYNG